MLCYRDSFDVLLDHLESPERAAFEDEINRPHVIIPRWFFLRWRGKTPATMLTEAFPFETAALGKDYWHRVHNRLESSYVATKKEVEEDVCPFD